jgi:hypothetical protein
MFRLPGFWFPTGEAAALLILGFATWLGFFTLFIFPGHAIFQSATYAFHNRSWGARP